MGVTVIPAWRLVGLLRSLPPSLTPERAREVAAQINRRLDAYTGRWHVAASGSSDAFRSWRQCLSGAPRPSAVKSLVGDRAVLLEHDPAGLRVVVALGVDALKLVEDPLDVFEPLPLGRPFLLYGRCAMKRGSVSC
jgi:hypothetical protein